MGITTVYWLTYTIAFLFIDGWHFKAISEGEILLDIIAKIGWNLGYTFWLIAVAQLAHILITNSKKS